MLMEQQKKMNEATMFQNFSSIKNQARSQLLSTFFKGVSRGTKPSTADSLITGQSNFLKAYATKVKWMPPQTDQWGLPLPVKSSQKSVREKSINETITKMKQFQIQDHEMKDNFYYIDHINEEIEKRLQNSTEKEHQSINVMEQFSKIGTLTSDQLLQGQMTSSVLSLADTPKDSQSPTKRAHQVGQIKPFDVPRKSLFIQPHLKQGQYRTTSNLKTLMKHPVDLKTKVKEKTQKSSVRDIIERSDLASDLLRFDRFLNAQKSYDELKIRDVSFKEDAQPWKHTLINANNNFDSHEKGLTNFKYLPQTMNDLKNLASKLSKEEKIRLIDKKSVSTVPEGFYIQVDKMQTDGDKRTVQDPSKDTMNYLIAKSKESVMHENIENLASHQKDVILSLEKLNLSSRIDTLVIQQWMQDMLTSVQTNSLSQLEKFELAQFIYNLCFLELAKQVSIHCSERGSLLTSLWTSFLDLMGAQLRHVKAEKNILEREAILSVDRFHQHYEQQVQEYKDQMLRMYKESMNYKRSYDRILKDFEQLTAKAAKVGQQLQEVTLLYKQKCQRVDFLEKTNNNLQGIIQALQEESEEEDPNLADDNYFKKKQKITKIVIDSGYTNSNFHQLGEKKDQNEIGYLSSLQVHDQFMVIDTLGNDMGGFLENSEQKRDKEQEALDNADQFTAAMRGDFFIDKGTQCREWTVMPFSKQEPEKQQLTDLQGDEDQVQADNKPQSDYIAIEDQEDQDQCKDEFFGYLIKQGYLKSTDSQVDQELIKMIDMGSLVNEDIIFEETGFDVRTSNEQGLIDRIKQLEYEVASLSTELKDTSFKLEIQQTFTELQKDRLQKLEQQLKERDEELEERQRQLSQVVLDLNEIREEKIRFEQKYDRVKEKNEALKKENDAIVKTLVNTQERLERYEGGDSREGDDTVVGLNVPGGKGKGRHRKTGSDGSKNTEGSGDYEYDDEDEKSSRRVKRGGHHRFPSSFLQNDRMRLRYKIMEFNLGKRQERKQRIHPSQIIFEKFKKKGKIKNIMPKTLLLKTITQTYNELMELHKTQRMPPLCPFIYDQMMQKYGIKKIGIDKFIQLLGTTVKMASTCQRISLFGRLLRLVKPIYDANDIKTYIEVYSYLLNLNIGVKIDNQDGEEAHLVPFVRAQECLRLHFEGKIPVDEWSDLRKKLDSQKKPDPKSVNKNGVVEVDEFIDLVLNQYHRLETLAAEKVFELFKAGDFNGNAFMSCDEFICIYRNVVQNNLGREYGQLIFQDYMEEIYDHDLALYGVSFDAFLHLALELDILKVKDQNSFLLPLNLEKQLGDLLQTFWKKERAWNQRIAFLGLKDSEWPEDISILRVQLKEESEPKRIVLLKAKLIEEETKNLIVDHYLDQFFSTDLNAFIKVGADDAYTKDYSERNVLTREQVLEKKKQAGIVEPKQEPILVEDDGKEEEGESGGPNTPLKKKKKKKNAKNKQSIISLR